MFRLLMVLGWTAALPLVGFPVFGLLTIIPLLGVFMGPRLLTFIYIAGAVPAFVTAAAFEFGLRRLAPAVSTVATIALGAVVSVLWIALYSLWEGGRVPLGADYLTFALAVSGAFAAAVMPITRFAKDRRRRA